MSSKSTHNQQQKPVNKVEYAFYVGRNLMVTIVALTSMVVTFSIGGKVAQYFQFGQFMEMVMRNFFVFLGLGVDLILLTALGAISMPKNKLKKVWLVAGSSIIVTVTLSLISNAFISKEVSGPSPYLKLAQEKEYIRRTDSIQKLKAFEVLSGAGSEERIRIEAATAKREQLIEEAVNSGSKSWKDDYLAHKDNKDAWFWTCKKCPAEYRRYRDGILAAEKEGNKTLAEAQGYSQQIAAVLSPTLNHNMLNDTSLNSMLAITQILEGERREKESTLFWVLVGLAIGGAVLSFVLSIVLKEVREEYGQTVDENHVGLFVVLFDFLGKISNILLDFLETVVSIPHEKLGNTSWWRAYQPTASSSWSPVAHEINGQQAKPTTNKSGRRANNQQQPQQPTDTGQQHEPNSQGDKKLGVGGACPPRGENKTAPRNVELTVDAKELVNTAERCRIRYKRSFSLQTKAARDRNYQWALEDANYLTQNGADVEFNEYDKKVYITLPKAQVTSE